jgi:hypothetical protein
VFENLAELLARVSDFSYGFDDGVMIKPPSPHLIGLPTDAPSRDELNRVVGVGLVQALVYEASGRRLDINYVSAREIVGSVQR